MIKRSYQFDPATCTEEYRGIVRDGVIGRNDINPMFNIMRTLAKLKLLTGGRKYPVSTDTWTSWVITVVTKR